MCDVQNNVQHTWHLVSQFVSWDFCRYMCEQNDRTSVDVLTFLRNMIVQRTEKSISDITKHEIIAKFLMEVKAVDSSRLPCITALSETVKRICPELESAVSKLIHHLQTFLRILGYNEESLKEEVIKESIDDAVYDFAKHATELLPQPDLLQIIETWNHHHHHSHTQQKPATKKVIYSAWLLEKVLECLHLESITQSEAKLIAVSIHEDATFEKILQNAEAEIETEADSELFSLQSSQPNECIFSQEFLKNTQQEILDAAARVQDTSNPDSLQLDAPFEVPDAVPDETSVVSSLSLHEPELNERMPDTSCIDIPEDPPQDMAPLLSPSLPRRISGNNGNVLEKSYSIFLNNENEGCMQFAVSSARESDSDAIESSLHTRINEKLTNLANRQKESSNQEESDSDTRDCDKNEGVRFLTPTLHKEGANNATAPKKGYIWLSDTDSNDSSINTTTGIGSQKNDPNWNRKALLQNAFYPPKKQYKTNPSKKKAIPLPDSDADDSDGSGMDDNADSDHSSSGDRFAAAFQRPTKRRRIEKTVKLYRSPNLSINDFHQIRRNIPNDSHKGPGPTVSSNVPRRPVPTVSSNISTRPVPTVSSKVPTRPVPSVSSKVPRHPVSITSSDFYRRPVSVTSHDVPRQPVSVTPSVFPRRPVSVTPGDVPMHRATNTKATKKRTPPGGAKRTKRQKCKQCNSAYKTVIALKRHIFLKHTAPNTPPDAVDSDVS